MPHAHILSNSLIGGGSMNPDKLSLDLQFATDKTLTARKGPTPVFTRSSTATYIGSDGLIQSSAINSPRFEHDPSTLACKGLLIEEQRTNMVSYSSQFENSTGWNQTRAIVTANQTTSPSGSSDADLITAQNSQYGGILRRATNPTYATNTTYTMSVYAKAGTHSYIGFRLSDESIPIGGLYPYFTLSGAGSATYFTPLGGSILSASCTSVGNGWYRCVLVYTTALTSTGGTTDIAITTSTGNTANTPAGTETVYLWGAQIELGAFPTSYIPTTTGTLTRSADICSITGSNFTSFYNQTEGTMFVNGYTPADTARTMLAVDDNTANQMIRLRGETTDPYFRVVNGGTEFVALDSGTISANTSFKFAGTYLANNFSAVVNNGTVVTDTSGTVPTVDRMRIGQGQSGNIMCGCLASVKYYKKKLSDAKIKIITT